MIEARRAQLNCGLLGVDEIVGGDKIGFELVDFAGVLQAGDGEIAAGETVLAGVGRGTELASLTGWSGAFAGVGPIGGEARIGQGKLAVLFRHE